MPADIEDYKHYTAKEGDFTDTETTQIELLLKFAGRILTKFTGGNWSAPVTDPDAPEDPDADLTAKVIQVQMVKRVLDNFDNFTQESVDGYSYSRAAGKIYLDDDEKSLLVAEGIAVVVSKPALYSISRNRNGGFPW